MAEQQPISKSMTTMHLEHVKGLLQSLKDDANHASADGDAYMLGIYNELVKVVSPIVVRATARLERQERATINKMHKNLLKASRQGTSSQPAEQAPDTVTNSAS